MNVSSTCMKQQLKESEKNLYPFLDLVNPKKTHLCDLEDNYQDRTKIVKKTCRAKNFKW